MPFKILAKTMKRKRYQYSKIFRDIYKFIGFVYSQIINNDDNIQIFFRRTRKTATCPKCNRRTSLTKESYKRTIRDLNLGPKRCYVTFYENKIRCKCGFRGMEKLDFVRPYSRCTIRFEDYVYSLCDKMSLSDVCRVVWLNWKTVKDIDKYYINKKKRSLVDVFPRRLGIDEVAYEKGHKYLTIVRDLDLNAVIWIGLNRRRETLDEFFNQLDDYKKSQIKIIIVDMYDPYIASIKENCPQANIVIDKFHVVKVVNKALDEIRKEEFSNATDDERKQMKHKRFVILKRNQNLNDKQREQLEVLMYNNNRLYQGYLLKEQIADILDENIMVTAINRMTIWKRNVLRSGFKPMEKALKTIERYYDKIENYFRYPYTNAGSEGFNNKIGVVKRRAYGFWDLEYFMLKIYQACGGLREDSA